MKTKISKSIMFIQENLFYISFAFVFFLWIFFVSRWGYDEIHEGQVLLSIKAFNNNLIVHRDFFEYKGLLFPYLVSFLQLQALPLVLHARLVTIILIFSSAFIAYLYLKRVSSNWKNILPIAWLLVSPPIMAWSSKPWPYQVLIDPNVLSVLMILLILALLSVDHRVRCQVTLFFWKYILAGILLGLLPWNRIQNLIFTVLILYFIIRTDSVAKTLKLVILISSAISMLAPLVVLWINDALDAWWSQIFMIPRVVAESKSNMVIMSLNQFYTTFIKFILFSLVLLLVVSIYFFVSKAMKSNLGIFLLNCLSLIFISIVGVAALTNNVNPDLNNSPSNWLIIFAQWFPFSIWHFFVVFSIALFFKVIVANIYKRLVSSQASVADTLTEELKRLLFAAICSVAFLYPNVGNLWSVSLPISLFVIRYLEIRIAERQTWSSQGLVLMSWEMKMRRIVSLIALSAIAFLPIANSQMRLNFASQDLNFIKTNNSEGARINDEIYKLVSQIPNIPSSTYFHCPFGLATMPHNTYLPNSENWGDIVYTVPNRKNEIDYADFLVVCCTPYPDNSLLVPADFVEINTANVGLTKIASLFHRTPQRSKSHETMTIKRE